MKCLGFCFGLLVFFCASVTAQQLDSLAVIGQIESFSLSSGAASEDLAKLGNAVGNRRIVLLGENGHGVGDFTKAKVQIVQYLHKQFGFNLIAFESGFYNGWLAEQKMGDQSLVKTIQTALMVQMHHSEIAPLFEYMAESKNSTRPLAFAGLDFQVQGWDTRTRPHYFYQALLASAPSIADTLAILDSIYVESRFQAADSTQKFILAHGEYLKALYDSAATKVVGTVQWVLQGASEEMARQILRSRAVLEGKDIPARYLEMRDEWMARTVARLAGPASLDNKIIVWLHNDHGRYGMWEQSGMRVRATGNFLKEWFPGQVYSVGFFMGGGTFVDNFRRERGVPEPKPGSIEWVMHLSGFPVALLQLSDSRGAAVKQWANIEHSYSRGNSIATMIPGQEFDAILYFDRVSPPRFDLGK